MNELLNIILSPSFILLVAVVGTLWVTAKHLLETESN